MISFMRFKKSMITENNSSDNSNSLMKRSRFMRFFLCMTSLILLVFLLPPVHAQVGPETSEGLEGWNAGVARAMGDVIEPTVYNGFKYTVIGTDGANPSSGSTEPDWPTEAGAQIIEYAQGEGGNVVESTVIDPDPDSGNIPDRYGNPAGGFPGAGKYLP